MIAVLTLSSVHRDIELAKFEAFLNREQCKEIKALVRGRQQLAYPIKGYNHFPVATYHLSALCSKCLPCSQVC